MKAHVMGWWMVIALMAGCHGSNDQGRQLFPKKANLTVRNSKQKPSKIAALTTRQPVGLANRVQLANIFNSSEDCQDADGDGWTTCGWLADCEDTNPAIYPGAPEICGDGIDNNCDWVTDDGCGSCEGVNCGWEGSACCGAGVCVDLGFDNNNCGACDVVCVSGATCWGGECLPTSCTEDFPQMCGNARVCVEETCASPCDSVADCINPRESCIDGGCFIPCQTGLDCIGGLRCCGGWCKPDGADACAECSYEICDGLDNDCDGVVDNDCSLPCQGDQDCPEWYVCYEEMGFCIEQMCKDEDHDGYYTCDYPGDCDDHNPLVHPGVPEICGDGIDNNCDSGIDDGCGTCEGVTCDWEGGACCGNGRCVDTAFDNNHCGACDNACLSGFVCWFGECAPGSCSDEFAVVCGNARVCIGETCVLPCQSSADCDNERENCINGGCFFRCQEDVDCIGELLCCGGLCKPWDTDACMNQSSR